MTLIIIELLSCLSTVTTSFLYEGRTLLLLGQENYKIKLGKLKECNEELQSNFFPTMNEDADKVRFYVDYFIFFIPIVNFVYSLFKGNIKYSEAIKNLKSKDIIIPMNEREKCFYNEIENKMEKISFVLFDSMDSYETDEVDNIKENKSCQLNENNNQVVIDNLTRKKQHQKDVSYLVSMLDFQDENAKNKVKTLRR